MFAIAFDLNTDQTERLHPKSTRRAYLDIALAVGRHGFKRVQGSVYVAETDDLVKLVSAVMALRALQWFGPSVKNLKVFRTDTGSDFTALMKQADMKSKN
jgi:virulence-associated protein VapD